MISQLSSGNDFLKRETTKPRLCYNFATMHCEIKNMIVLFLPFEDILKIKNLYEDESYMQIHSLLYSSNQKQLKFRFTRDMQRVFSKWQLPRLGIRSDNCSKICTELVNIQKVAGQLSCVITTSKSGVMSSSRDKPEQDVDRTLDGNYRTFWSSAGSKHEDKVDWLLYDLGTVAVISRISVAAFRALWHAKSPVYGFKKCWIEFGFERDEFHYKTKEFSCANEDQLQNFITKEHFDNLLPAARFIKFWMKGCHQKQEHDNHWYFALRVFQVAAIPVRYFPEPVPNILNIGEDLKSKSREWLFETYCVSEKSSRTSATKAL